MYFSELLSDNCFFYNVVIPKIAIKIAKTSVFYKISVNFPTLLEDLCISKKNILFHALFTVGSLVLIQLLAINTSLYHRRQNESNCKDFSYTSGK